MIHTVMGGDGGKKKRATRKVLRGGGGGSETNKTKGFPPLAFFAFCANETRSMHLHKFTSVHLSLCS